MARDKKLKEIDIKSRRCYYFNDIININGLDLDNTLLKKKSYESILTYHARYKTSCDPKPWF